MTEKDQIETWWLEIPLWPSVVLRVETDVYVETRGLPGMRSYQCMWNDWVAWYWAAREYMHR